VLQDSEILVDYTQWT